MVALAAVAAAEEEEEVPAVAVQWAMVEVQPTAVVAVVDGELMAVGRAAVVSPVVWPAASDDPALVWRRRRVTAALASGVTRVGVRE